MIILFVSKETNSQVPKPALITAGVIGVPLLTGFLWTYLAKLHKTLVQAKEGKISKTQTAKKILLNPLVMLSVVSVMFYTLHRLSKPVWINPYDD